MRADGTLCPRYQNEPRSLDGAIAWRLLTTGSGQWLRCGMSGTVIGLDLQACLSRPSARDADPEVLEALLLAAEPVVIAKMAEKGQSEP